MSETTRARSGSSKQQPKYRASCDSCNEAKVKCSQTRPSCARCIKNYVHCVYGISQRAGKYSARSQSNQVNNQVSNQIGYQMRRDTNFGSGPPALPATTDIDRSSSSSAVDSTEMMLSMPLGAAGSADFQDLLKKQQQQQQRQSWAFDRNMLDTDITVPSRTAANSLSYQSIFSRDDLRMASLQSAGRPSSRQFDDDGMDTLTGHDSLGLFTPTTGTLSLSAKMSAFDENVFNQDLTASFAPSPQDTSPRSKCRCGNNLITQLSSLPLLLHPERSAFDAELVQFQEAIRLCTTCLGCQCAGQDSTSVLSLAMLIARITNVLERRLPTGDGGDDGSAHDEDATSDISSSKPSPKFSLGAYIIDVDDDRRLKQEVWWLQVKKMEALVAGFREMVRVQGREQQDLVQGQAWEKLCFLLEHKIQTVKRESMKARAKA